MNDLLTSIIKGRVLKLLSRLARLLFEVIIIRLMVYFLFYVMISYKYNEIFVKVEIF